MDETTKSNQRRQHPEWGWADGAYFTNETADAALLAELGFSVTLLDEPAPSGRYVFRVEQGKAEIPLERAFRALYDPSLWSADEAEKVRFYRGASAWLRKLTGQVLELKARRRA